MNKDPPKPIHRRRSSPSGIAAVEGHEEKDTTILKIGSTKDPQVADVGMAAHQVLHMIGGVGDKSYANNSLVQKRALLKAKPILEETIRRVYRSILPNCLKVVDLGCSSGPNALQVVFDVINIVDTTCCNLNLRLPVFQFFLNDLFGNDFNTIFNSLPQFYKTLEENKGNKFGPCFINATPGTFYKRLFPNNSLHFFHSSYSLHWLSQAPKGLANGLEPPNRDICLTSKSPPTMHKAYLEQFQCDVKSFLKSRSEELVPGGGTVLTLIGRRGETSEIRTAWGLFGMALNDMLLEDLIEEVKLESFFLPAYDPTIEEAKQVIEEEGSFTIQRLETITMGWDYNNDNEGADDNILVDEKMRGEFITKYMRAVAEPLLKAQFGEEVMDDLFLRFKNKAVQLIMDVEILEFPSLVISLTKNA